MREGEGVREGEGMREGEGEGKGEGKGEGEVRVRPRAIACVAHVCMRTCVFQAWCAGAATPPSNAPTPTEHGAFLFFLLYLIGGEA